MYSIGMRRDARRLPERRAGRCTVCGGSLVQEGGRYWITDHPDGVHEACRIWEREPFPFTADLERLRQVAVTVRRAWRAVLRDGRWLAKVEREWPADARRRAREWLTRKQRLQHHLSRLRDRLRP